VRSPDIKNVWPLGGGGRVREVVVKIDEDSPLADGPWLVQPMLDAVHVVFEAEAQQHEMDRGCWCGPDVEWRDPQTDTAHGKPLVVHRRPVGGEA
jgi:hypothetical protein